MGVVLSSRGHGGRARARNRLLILVSVCASLLAVVAIAPTLAGGSALADTACANEAFRNGPSSHLPDCRAYEMVSPTDKNGGGVDGGLQLESIPAPQQAAANGESVTYASQTAFTSAGAKVALTGNQYISRRGPGGWSTEAITPPQIYPGGELDKSTSALNYSLYQGFTESLSSGFLASEEPPLSPQAPHDFYNPYLRNLLGSGYELLSTVTPPDTKPGPVDCCQEPPGFRVTYGGMSADSEHVIFEANDAVAPGAIPGAQNLYEWNEGQLELISALPNEEAIAEGTLGGVDETFNRQGAQNYKDYYRAISSDGSRVFWTGPPPERGIYMHESTTLGARTVQIGKGKYWGSSTDGSIVYYGEKGGNFNGEVPGGDLYRYDTESGHTTDIAPGADLAGVLGMSEDGSYVYFVGEGVIAPGAVAGGNNLYLWHGTGAETGTLTFIVTLGLSNIEREDWFAGLPERTSRVSPDGQFVAFDTVEPLSGYDNAPLHPEEACPSNSERALANFNYSKRCSEVYEYDAAANSLRCVSCNPSGAPPIGDSVVPGGFNFLQAGEGWQSNTEQQRYLEDDGRLFFNSYEALLPQATDNSENVYEFEPDGVGSCASASGCIYLISAGTGDGKSVFLDAGANGNDVFFVTYDRLVPQDGDELADVYDARADGGFSLPEVPACSGEACKPPNTLAPSIYGAPASAAFQGPGNPFVVPVAATTAKPKATVKKKKKKQAKPKSKRGRQGKKHGKSSKKGKR